jgi:hypothetical protein
MGGTVRVLFLMVSDVGTLDFRCFGASAVNSVLDQTHFGRTYTAGTAAAKFRMRTRL